MMVDFKETPMTKEQADFVRYLRVKRGYTWRAVARDMAKTWPELNIKTHPDGSGFQCDGADICAEAATFFGEKAEEEPWN